MEEKGYEGLKAKVEKYIREKALPALMAFIKVPNLSREFDAGWASNGLLEQAGQVCIDFAKSMDVRGLEIRMLEEEGRAPLIIGAIEASRVEKPKNIITQPALRKRRSGRRLQLLHGGLLDQSHAGPGPTTRPNHIVLRG